MGLIGSADIAAAALTAAVTAFLEQIITSHNAIYNANCATMPNVHLMF